MMIRLCYYVTGSRVSRGAPWGGAFEGPNMPQAPELIKKKVKGSALTIALLIIK